MLNLKPPPYGEPRWGDDVVWYQGPTQSRGTVLGFWEDGKVRVRNKESGTESNLQSRDAVRRADPALPRNSVWELLPPCAVISTPDNDILGRFSALLSETLPPGISIQTFANEIWARGFEVVIAGGSVRDVLIGKHPSVIDLVTAMPLPRVEALARNMFDRSLAGADEPDTVGSEAVGPITRVTIGSTDWFSGLSITVRNPCVHDPDKLPLFGEDWGNDARLRDFTCNAVYFDVINGVLIDPLGVALAHLTDRQLHSTDLSQQHVLPPDMAG